MHVRQYLRSGTNTPRATSRSGRAIMRALALLIGIALILFAYDQYIEISGATFSHENMAFRELGSLAHQMILDKAPGVISGPDGPYIKSFDALYDYVAANQPDIVRGRASPNPFPGILEGTSYDRAQAATSYAPDDLLFWSPRVFNRPIGRVQLRLTRSGKVLDILDSSKFERKKWPATAPHGLRDEVNASTSPTK